MLGYAPELDICAGVGFGRIIHAIQTTDFQPVNGKRLYFEQRLMQIYIDSKKFSANNTRSNKLTMPSQLMSPGMLQSNGVS